MNETTDCEIWLAINAEGEYAANEDREACEEDFSGAYRLIKLVLKVPIPGPLVLTAVLPDQTGSVTLTVQQ